MPPALGTQGNPAPFVPIKGFQRMSDKPLEMLDFSAEIDGLPLGRRF
jgi:hypothetical protein